MKRAVSLIFFILFPVSLCSAEDTLSLRQFDVGEGNALLLTQGLESLLVDAGNPMAATKLIREVMALKPGTLRLLLTHPHQDHIGGVFQVLNELKIEKVYDNGQSLEGQEEPYRWYVETVRIPERSYEALHAGDSLSLGKAQIVVLSPPPGPLDNDWNKNSLVLKVVFGNFCALLMADALVSTEQYLLHTEGIDLACPLVQVGHHGSKFASTPDFVSATKAKTALISVNSNNIRGYPAAESLAVWKKHGARLLRTDESGTILFTAESSGKYSISTER